MIQAKKVVVPYTDEEYAEFRARLIQLGHIIPDPTHVGNDRPYLSQTAVKALKERLVRLQLLKPKLRVISANR